MVVGEDELDDFTELLCYEISSPEFEQLWINYILVLDVFLYEMGLSSCSRILLSVLNNEMFEYGKTLIKCIHDEDTVVLVHDIIK